MRYAIRQMATMRESTSPVPETSGKNTVTLSHLSTRAKYSILGPLPRTEPSNFTTPRVTLSCVKTAQESPALVKILAGVNQPNLREFTLNRERVGFHNPADYRVTANLLGIEFRQVEPCPTMQTHNQPHRTVRNHS